MDFCQTWSRLVNEFSSNNLLAWTHSSPGARQINFNPYFPVNIQYKKAAKAYVGMNISNVYFFFKEWIVFNWRKVTYLSNTLDGKLILTCPLVEINAGVYFHQPLCYLCLIIFQAKYFNRYNWTNLTGCEHIHYR